MSNKRKRRQRLFYPHIADLESILPDVGQQFVCPLCLGVFDKSRLHKSLTDGHVWPKYIRREFSSDLKDRYRVLLCDNCNKKAGDRGDKQMQEHEKLIDGDASGNLYGKRRIEIFRCGPSTPHFELSGEISGLQGNRIENMKLDLSDLTAEERVNLQKTMRSNLVDMHVHPPEYLIPEVAKAGWITAGYLMAFFTFGYRYIFQESTQAVLDYIRCSFVDDSEQEMRFSELEGVGVFRCSKHFCNQPKVAIVVPANDRKTILLEINLLNRHIRLPIECDPHMLSHILARGIPDLMTRLPEMVAEDSHVMIAIHCNKSRPHQCLWDHVLGTPSIAVAA